MSSRELLRSLRINIRLAHIHIRGMPHRLVEIAQVAYEEAEEVLLQANGEMYEAIDRLLGSKGRDIREVLNFFTCFPCCGGFIVASCV